MSVSFMARILCIFLCLFSVVAMAGNIQPVYSFKNLGIHKASDGSSFKRIQVKCNTRSGFTYITNSLKTKEWCINGDSSACFDARMDAATQACLEDVVEIIATPKSVIEPTAEEVSAIARREKLEEELLQTQQKTLEIQNRQLELRRKELELMKQKDTS